MLCAACGDSTETSPCAHCGAVPELDARYQLRSRLGSEDGATGVFLAHDTQEDRPVTVKERVFASGRDLKDWELFDREWQVLSQLDHPRVPRYIDHFEQGEGRRLALYIVVEHVEGESLQQALARSRGTAAQAVRTVIEVLEIVDDLHRLSPPVIHRDIKPANIIRGEDGTLHLIDFGSVKAALQTTPGSTVVGTFGYMAPEQLQGDASPASDLYACGALLLAILTREDPARLLGVGRPTWREHIRISDALATVIDALTAAEPGHRPASAAAAVHALRATPEITGETPTAPFSGAEPTPPTRALAPVGPASLAAGSEASGVTDAERTYAASLARSLTKPGITAKHRTKAIGRVLADPGIPLERRPMVQAEVRRMVHREKQVEFRRQLPIAGLMMMGIGVAVPAFTMLAFGLKAWSHFGWFAGMFPVGAIMLLASTRGQTGPRRRRLTAGDSELGSGVE